MDDYTFIFGAALAFLLLVVIVAVITRWAASR